MHAESHGSGTIAGPYAGDIRYGRTVGSPVYGPGMTAADHLEVTRRRYDEMASLYADHVEAYGDDDHLDRAMVLSFAALVRGSGQMSVLDAGCGPGQDTDLLARTGLDASGVDLSPAMVTLARARRPDLRFDVGSLLKLDLPDARFGGVLAHFSMIHTPPAQLPVVLAEFARVLAPGGYLLLSFQSGDDALDSWAAFDHRVAPAYRWSLGAVVDLLGPAGLTEHARLRVLDAPRQRFPAGHVLARKPAPVPGDA